MAPSLAQSRLLMRLRMRALPLPQLQLTTQRCVGAPQQQQRRLRSSVMCRTRCSRWGARGFLSASSSGNDASTFLSIFERSGSNSNGGESGDVTKTKTKREGDTFAVDTLPALRVISETLALVKQSPAFQNWNSTDWLMGLTVLAQHNTIQRKKRNVLSILTDETNKKSLENQELMGKLLKHVRVCDAVYASTISGFCQESGVERENIVKYHNGGVLSPKYILLLDHKSREIVVVVRGSASIMDFCTDLCLVNEPFKSGEGHRGMVHAAKWLANHLQDDLERLTAEYPEYQLITTGHSLGAAVAAIATMALKQNFPRVHCYAFATPASVTRNLAEECYDYVTSVVAGDDCVPRLHQHSIYKLQGEVSKFDWRNTLKQMVTEEVAEQTTFVQKQKDEKLEQIYQAIRKFEELSIKQQNDALEKIDQVKRLATENIAEFTSEIDRRVVKTIDSTLSPFRADKISLNHIKFVQNLLKADEKDKFPFLWQKLDSSVLVLERLSASVNKPEQLERLIKESKELLKHTTPATKKIVSTVSDVVPPLMLLRDRINNVIVQATDSLKSEVKGTMSKVTETVSSNVHEYVETVKNEAEEISSRIQQEIDSAQKEIAESAETFAAKTQQIPSVETVVDSMFQDLKVLTQYYTVDGELREMGEEDDEELLEEVDPHAEEEEEEVISMLEGEKALMASQEEAGGSNTLHHDPLFPPGRILYLNRVPLSEAQSSELSLGSLGEEVEMVEVGNDEFSRVVLSNKMILDHLCTTYERMLKSTKILASSQEPQSVADIQAREFI